MRFKTEDVLTSVQLVVVMSEFSCNVKLIEGTIQEISALVPDGVMSSCGAGVDSKLKIRPSLEPPAAATNLAPLADEATARHCRGGTLFEIQIAPQSVEVKMPPFPAVTNLVPSAEEATEYQVLLAALEAVQVTPESTEV